MKTSRVILLIAMLISLANFNTSLAKRRSLPDDLKRPEPSTSSPVVQVPATNRGTAPTINSQVTDVGPELGFVEGLSGYLIDPGNPSEILASTGITIFKSTNAGTSWHPAGVGLDSNGFLAVTPNIRSDPNNPHTVYAVGDSGLYRSTDFGEHWTQLW